MILNRRRKKIEENLLNKFGDFKDDSFDFKSIEEYFKKKDNSDAYQVLSDKTCNDLDFHELFMFIDRTNSKIGQQYLYNKLRCIPNELKEITVHEELITEFTNNPKFRVYIQRYLSKLNSYDSYYITSLFQNEHIQPPKWFFIIRLLSLTSLIVLFALFFNFAFLFILLGVFIINVGIHFWNKKNLFQYISSIPQLLKLNGIARELYKNDSLKEINPNLQVSINIIDKVRNRMSFFKLEAKIQGEFETLFWGIMELIKILFLLEPLLLYGVLKELETKRKEIEDVFKFVGLIDSLISIASLRKSLTCQCKPSILNGKQEIIANDVYHPLIPDCVKNSIHVNSKSILLTGSNMSGKTSFIRSIGITIITGLTINTCFAESFSMSRMRVYSAIRISDDLMNDRSYYFEEVLTIKEMIGKSKNQEQNLFLLDEIFKGTNTVERISAGKAVLSYLSKANNIVFVSTHDIELADLLADSYELYHFSEKVDNNTVDFDYKLKNGKLKNRNAIRILQINDYPQSIIDEAIELSKELDKTVFASKN